MATTTELLTAEEFFQLPDPGQPAELIRGVVVTMNMPGARHGQVCGQIAYLLKDFLKGRDLGHAITNDAGIVTRRNPDTVRGADVAYYSFARLPRGVAPRGYASLAPEVVFEVLSPSDSWSEILTKAGEYLKAGVLAVAVFEPEEESVRVYRPKAPPVSLTADGILALPEIHDEFRILAASFFE